MKGMFNFGLLGIRRVFGGVMPPKPSIDKWVKEHMVFWYDMTKPVDVYTQNFNDWQNYNPNSVSITNNKIVVNGLIDNFRIASIGKETESFSVFIEGLGDKNLVYRVKLDENSDQITNIKLKDGENVLPHSFATTVAFMGVSGVTDYIGLTITQLPSGQSVPTNEILKANPYLQDFSGNNRPLKLNNFLFAAMSGVGGYEINWADTTIWANFLGSRFEGKIESSKLTITSALVPSGIMETKVPSFSIGYKVRVTGITDESLIYSYTYEDGQSLAITIAKDGEYELPSNNVVEATYNMRWRVIAASYPHTCNITIEQIPAYPNALVTDGVDDYGVMENLQQGVKVLFVTINPFIDGKFIYDQRLNTTEPWLFAVFNDKGSIAYNSRNSNGKTYIDGTLNESTIVSALLNKKQIITIVNNDVTGDKTKTPIFFSNTDHDSGWISSAFYNSIGFDSVPTQQTDGFTDQDLITWVIDNMINGTPQSGVFPYVFPLKVN